MSPIQDFYQKVILSRQDFILSSILTSLRDFRVCWQFIRLTYKPAVCEIILMHLISSQAEFDAFPINYSNGNTSNRIIMIKNDRLNLEELLSTHSPTSNSPTHQTKNRYETHIPKPRTWMLQKNRFCISNNRKSCPILRMLPR